MLCRYPGVVIPPSVVICDSAQVVVLILLVLVYSDVLMRRAVRLVLHSGHGHAPLRPLKICQSPQKNYAVRQS